MQNQLVCLQWWWVCQSFLSFHMFRRCSSLSLSLFFWAKKIRQNPTRIDISFWFAFISALDFGLLEGGSLQLLPRSSVKFHSSRLSPEALSLSWYNQNDDMYRIPCVKQQRRSIPWNDNANCCATDFSRPFIGDMNMALLFLHRVKVHSRQDLFPILQMSRIKSFYLRLMVYANAVCL